MIKQQRLESEKEIYNWHLSKEHKQQNQNLCFGPSVYILGHYTQHSDV